MIFAFIINLVVAFKYYLCIFHHDLNVGSQGMPVGMPNDKLGIVPKRPNEAAKMFAMYLLQAGVLCEYSKGNKPSVIMHLSVSSPRGGGGRA